MEVIASVSELTVRYGKETAVDHVSFDVQKGEILAVIGPNGSGKTSTVECLEGLRKPTEGRVRVFSQDPLSHREEIYHQLGVQLQDVSYPDRIKVQELCAWFSSFYDAPAEYQRLLEQLDLEKSREQYVSKLSGGQKQRLSILLSLLPRPNLLILDELTTGLDPEVRRSLWESLRTIRNNGTGILLVSHYMEEVTAIADRMVFLLDGKAIYVGSLDGFWDYAHRTLPKDRFHANASLEDLYLAFVPQRKHLTMEEL